MKTIKIAIFPRNRDGGELLADALTHKFKNIEIEIFPHRLAFEKMTPDFDIAFIAQDFSENYGDGTMVAKQLRENCPDMLRVTYANGVEISTEHRLLASSINAIQLCMQDLNVNEVRRFAEEAIHKILNDDERSETFNEVGLD